MAFCHPMGKYVLRPDSIRKLFDTVAPSYDFLNRLLSLRRDVTWRKEAVKELRGTTGWILDLATGTGDVALEVIRQGNGERRVMGVDFSEAMIRCGNRKVLRKGLSGTISLSLGDALALPFRDNTFSACIITFGLRNILEKERALSEMGRVTRAYGKVVVLEFTLPQDGWIRKLYPLYFLKILPRVGGWISGDRGAYAYLPESVLQFGHSENYEELMRRSGLTQVTSRPLTCGIASVMVGLKSLS
jgi:demethylmenaquinone methyltransferase/2-methoxy-6-polyprenyl-1,4-benzoquinol methylase